MSPSRSSTRRTSRPSSSAVTVRPPSLFALSLSRAPQLTRLFRRLAVDEKDEVVSMITRESIDVLKSTFRDDVCVPFLPLARPSVLLLTCASPAAAPSPSGCSSPGTSSRCSTSRRARRPSPLLVRLSLFLFRSLSHSLSRRSSAIPSPLFPCWTRRLCHHRSSQCMYYSSPSLVDRRARPATSAARLRVHRELALLAHENVRNSVRLSSSQSREARRTGLCARSRSPRSSLHRLDRISLLDPALQHRPAM